MSLFVAFLSGLTKHSPKADIYNSTNDSKRDSDINFFCRTFQLGEILERDGRCCCTYFVLQTGEQSDRSLHMSTLKLIRPNFFPHCRSFAATLPTTNCCLLSPSRAPHLLSTSSRREWSWRPRTRETPHPPALPQWWAWQAHGCASAWTGRTTRMTSGAWWTPRRSSLLAAVRRTEACCNHHSVRTHTHTQRCPFKVLFLILSWNISRSFPRIWLLFKFCPLDVSDWLQIINVCCFGLWIT